MGELHWAFTAQAKIYQSQHACKEAAIVSKPKLERPENGEVLIKPGSQ
jgi:hypothetical protein